MFYSDVLKQYLSLEVASLPRVGKNILGLVGSIISQKEMMEIMPAAFVLINAEIGSEDKVLEKLREIEGVVEANIVYGVYDIIAKIEAESMDKLKDTVTWKVRKLEGVRSTLTMIVVEGSK